MDSLRKRKRQKNRRSPECLTHGSNITNVFPFPFSCALSHATRVHLNGNSDSSVDNNSGDLFGQSSNHTKAIASFSVIALNGIQLSILPVNLAIVSQRTISNSEKQPEIKTPINQKIRLNHRQHGQNASAPKMRNQQEYGKIEICFREVCRKSVNKRTQRVSRTTWTFCLTPHTRRMPPPTFWFIFQLCHVCALSPGPQYSHNKITLIKRCRPLVYRNESAKGRH